MMMLLILAVGANYSLFCALLVETDQVEGLLMLFANELLSQIFLHYLTIIIVSQLYFSLI